MLSLNETTAHPYIRGNYVIVSSTWGKYNDFLLNLHWMSDVIYHIIAILVAVYAVVRGFRAGLTGLVTSVLGMAFGIVCSHIFLEAMTEIVESVLPRPLLERGGMYLASNLAVGIVFGVVYSIFSIVTAIIRRAMEDFGSGLLDSLLGVAFCLVNYLLMLSIAYNILVGLNPESALMRYGKSDDGNIIEAVVWIAPAFLGSESFSEYAHEEQLREAKKISSNIRREINVEINKDRVEMNSSALSIYT